MPQLNPVNPGLAQVIGAMDMINPVKPNGDPSVALQVLQAAQQVMAPQAPMMPQAPQMPNVQDIAQDAATGNQVQMMQQQQQQQEMMQAMQQMMQQKQAQENAMRFGVAAAPGAQTIRMAEGGIVGYAEGDLTSERLARIAAEEEEARRRGLGRFDPKSSDEVREAMRNRAEAQARLRAQAAAAAPAAAEAAPAARGVMPLLRAVGSKALGPAAALYGVYDALKDPESRAQTEDFFRGVLGFGPVNRPDENAVAKASRTPLGATPPEETVDNMATYSQEGRNYRAPVQDRFGIADLMRGMGGEGVGPGAGGPRMPMVAAPMGPRMSDKYGSDALRALREFEVGTPQRAEVERQLAENREITNAALRAAGLRPDQRALDEAESRARQTRREEGIEALRRASEESRGGMNRVMEVLAAGSGRAVPGAMGQQYVNMLRRDLAENERFMNAMERARTEGEIERVALREKTRADVIGDVKTSREQAAKAMDARNKKREAEITMATEFYKTERKAEEGALDRQHQVAIEQFRASVQQVANQGLKREQELRHIDANRNRYIQGFERLYREKVRDLGILNPGNPSPAERKALDKLEAERDAAIAKLEAEAAEARTRVMGGGGGSAIKVEPIKSSK